MLKNNIRHRLKFTMKNFNKLFFCFLPLILFFSSLNQPVGAYGNQNSENVEARIVKIVEEKEIIVINRKEGWIIRF